MNVRSPSTTSTLSRLRFRALTERDPFRAAKDSWFWWPDMSSTSNWLWSMKVGLVLLYFGENFEGKKKHSLNCAAHVFLAAYRKLLLKKLVLSQNKKSKNMLFFKNYTCLFNRAEIELSFNTVRNYHMLPIVFNEDPGLLLKKPRNGLRLGNSLPVFKPDDAVSSGWYTHDDSSCVQCLPETPMSDFIFFAGSFTNRNEPAVITCQLCDKITSSITNQVPGNR